MPLICFFKANFIRLIETQVISGTVFFYESTSFHVDQYPHGLINYKDTKTKCRLYWCSIEFKDWRYVRSCWYFDPALRTNAPLTFSLVHLPPLPKVKYIHNTYRQCAAGRGWGRMWSCVGDHFLQEFNTLFLIRFIT